MFGGIGEKMRDMRWRKSPVRAPEGHYWDLVRSGMHDLYGELVLVEVGREVNEYGFYVRSRKSTDTLTYPAWGEDVKSPNDIRAASKRLLDKRERAQMNAEEFSVVREHVRKSQHE